MYVQSEFIHLPYLCEDVEFLLKHVRKQDRWLYDVLAAAYRTAFGRIDIQDRTHTLARNLHQAELRQRQDIVLGAIVLHHLLHVLEELLAMFLLLKVDKVDHHYSAHIPQAHLSCNLVGSSHIDKQGILFLIIALTAAMSAIDIDDVQSLSMFDNDICSLLA